MNLVVRVPATTANVGSGFDCVGIAVDWYDELELEVVGDELVVEVEGEGAGKVPTDESHLVVSSIRRGLEEWGDGVLPGLRLRCRNSIPHARGLGSSAAAIVAGLAFAWGIARHEPMDLDELARLASRLEGHADNAAAAVWGGATLGWVGEDLIDVQRLALDATLSARVWVPTFEVPTSGARAVLPDAVPRSDAVAQAARAALLMVALQRDPSLLLRATDDSLHQQYRAELMAPSFDAMRALRAAGVPATISGAGPTVFAVGTTEQLAAADGIVAKGFAEHRLGLGHGVYLG